AIYGDVLERWARWSPPRPLALSPSPAAWRAAWDSGTPLAAEAARVLRAADVEDLVGAAMDALARVEPSLGPALQRFAEAWDGGAVGPTALLPERGRIGAGSVVAGLGAGAIAFLAGGSLRPRAGRGLGLAPLRPDRASPGLLAADPVHRPARPLIVPPSHRECGKIPPSLMFPSICIRA